MPTSQDHSRIIQDSEWKHTKPFGVQKKSASLGQSLQTRSQQAGPAHRRILFGIFFWLF